MLEKMREAFVECENPNDMLYRFEGTMGLGGDRKGNLIPLGPDQILLRGSSLRNTETAYGLVVFTGHETKIMKNSVKSRAKFSKLELSTNKYIFMIVILQFIISLTGAIFNTVWNEVKSTQL
jgi:magnesium-transporting ATPase (P-type)